VVIFNICHSTPLAEAIAKDIDFAIGMNTSIGDESALVFAAAFYRALGFGRTVQEAFELGKNELELKGIPENQTPELHHHPSVDPMRVRLVGPPEPRRLL